MAKVNDGRIEKTQKKGRERKLSSLELDKILDIHNECDASDKSSCCAEKQEKKQPGIVIDGRTFTCATCKAGHRVGVCKHGKERPMKPTHPPGRPSAGQPKKVVCDCPKNCTCAKRDCKCPRNCNCTQTMFMLVYIPAPGMEDNPEDEHGSWKIGEEVTTDLKGNILSPDQIEERRKHKEQMKTESSGRTPSHSRPSIQMQKQPPISPSLAKPISSGGCCNHKETIAKQNEAAKAIAVVAPMPTTASRGCNCGAQCSCQFCPEHPNNSASMNLARQQYMHFRNQQPTDDSNNVLIASNLPLGGSCMGGQPRFVMSTFSAPPSAAELAQTFGAPEHYGYIIGYPVEQLRDDSDDTIPQADHLTTSTHVASQIPTQHVSPDLSNPQLDLLDDSFGLLQDDFNIGNAFVASAGPHGWQSSYFSGEAWPMSSPAEFMAPTFDLEFDRSTNAATDAAPAMPGGHSDALSHVKMVQNVNSVPISYSQQRSSYGNVPNFDQRNIELDFKNYGGESYIPVQTSSVSTLFSPVQNGTR